MASASRPDLGDHVVQRRRDRGVHVVAGVVGEVTHLRAGTRDPRRSGRVGLYLRPHLLLPHRHGRFIAFDRLAHRNLGRSTWLATLGNLKVSVQVKVQRFEKRGEVTL